MTQEDQADIHEYTGPQDYKTSQDGQRQKPETSLCIHTLEHPDFTNTLEETCRSMQLVFTVMDPLPGAFLRRCLRSWAVGNSHRTRMCRHGPAGALRSWECPHLLLHGRRHFLLIVLQTDATVSWLKPQYIPWEWKKPRTMRCGCQHRQTSILGQIYGVDRVFFLKQRILT